MGIAKKLGLGLLVVVVGFLAFVATRPSHFRYERSGLIAAAPEAIYPYLSSFEKCAQWNPYDRKDPAMKRTIQGTDGTVGSKLEFVGNSETGSGQLEFLKVEPNRFVELRLTMTSPVKAENLVRYELKPEAGGTRFTWSMEGDSGFIGKLFGVIIDCEKMVAGDFEKGIANLKALVEGAHS